MLERRRVLLISESIGEVENNVNQIFYDSVNAPIDPDKFLERYGANKEDLQEVEGQLRKVDKDALRAVPEGDLNSLGRKIIDSEKLTKDFESIVDDRVEIEMASYAADYEDFFGSSFDKLTDTQQNAHRAKVNERIRSSYFAPIYLGLKINEAKGKYIIEDIIDNDNENKSIINAAKDLKKYSLQLGLKDIQDSAGFEGLFNFIEQAQYPTIRIDLKKLASKDATPEDLDKTIEDISKYGVSALIDQNMPRLEYADQLSKAIANLRTRPGFEDIEYHVQKTPLLAI